LSCKFSENREREREGEKKREMGRKRERERESCFFCEYPNDYGELRFCFSLSVSENMHSGNSFGASEYCHLTRFAALFLLRKREREERERERERERE
jgi:hypothetical protein